MVNERHYARMPLFKAWRLPARLPASLSPCRCPSRSLSLPPRWSSQLGWMRLIFDSSCANASPALGECCMNPNLTHRLKYIHSPELCLGKGQILKGSCFINILALQDEKYLCSIFWLNRTHFKGGSSSNIKLIWCFFHFLYSNPSSLYCTNSSCGQINQYCFIFLFLMFWWVLEWKTLKSFKSIHWRLVWN